MELRKRKRMDTPQEIDTPASESCRRTYETRHKAPKTKEEIEALPILVSTIYNQVDDTWVSATAIHNVLMNDQYSDWLKLYGEQKGETKGEFLSQILEQGKDFEKNVINFLRQQFEVVSVSDKYSETAVCDTIACMIRGVPLIHSASLKNPRNKTYGVADLLVRSDYLNRLTQIPSLNTAKFNKECIFGKYQYVVIDIKCSTLPMDASGVFLHNQDHFKAYKSQLLIYNEALGQTQGYTPSQAYILGRRVKFVSKGQTFTEESCLNRLGTIDYSGYDEKYRALTKDAVQWIKELRAYGKTWTFKDHPELYPNMKVEGFYDKEKQKVAEEIGEITQLWQCGIDKREKALSRGVCSWRDPRFSSKSVELSGKRGETLDQILEVNRGSQNILPFQLKNITKNLLSKMNHECFVDFETIGSAFDDFTTLPYSSSTPMIFMITAGWETNKDQVEEGGGRWCSKTFTAREMSDAEELRIMKEFIEFVDDAELYHWSDAEVNEWNRALRRHPEIEVNPIENQWTNLLQVFRDEPVTVKGALNFGLKSVAKAMSKCGLITGDWDTQTQSGLDAMSVAYNAYKTGKLDALEDIEKYNQIDCKMLWKILKYLRTCSARESNN